MATEATFAKEATRVEWDTDGAKKVESIKIAARQAKLTTLDTGKIWKPNSPIESSPVCRASHPILSLLRGLPCFVMLVLCDVILDTLVDIFVL